MERSRSRTLACSATTQRLDSWLAPASGQTVDALILQSGPFCVRTRRATLTRDDLVPAIQP